MFVGVFMIVCFIARVHICVGMRARSTVDVSASHMYVAGWRMIQITDLHVFVRV